MVAHMSGRADILLLAGSMEARAIAQSIAGLGLQVHAVLTEPSKGPTPPPVPFDLIEQPRAEDLMTLATGARAIVDASHGFDQALTSAGFAAATAASIPFLNFSRPAWSDAENPLWRAAPDVRAAMQLVPPGARVFSATGWSSLPECATFPGSKLLLRQTHRHDRLPPFDFVELAFDQAPFTVAGEIALFRKRAVDLLICRNLGGVASRPKLDAAAALKMPVVLVNRPALPKGVRSVDNTAAVVDWVAGL